VGFGFEIRKVVDKVRDKRSERGGANARRVLDISMLVRIRPYGVGKGIQMFNNRTCMQRQKEASLYGAHADSKLVSTKVEAPIIGATVTESDDRVTRDGMAEFGANHP
jgi:hypothetical protein